MEKVGGTFFSRNLGGSALITPINALPLSFCKIDVSFPEKFRKIVATRGEIFSLKLTKYRLAAALRPDPLGELKRSPRPPSRKKGGGLLLRGGERREGGREGRGEGRGKGRGELAPRC